MSGGDGVQRIHTLDGLRGWLALYVAVYHLAAPLTGPGAALAPIKPWLSGAWWTVDMFFVMSGFVMMHVYRQVFAQRIEAGACWGFMKARFARLYPVHLLALLLMLPGFWRMPDHEELWLVQDGRYSADAFVKSLLMLHGPWMESRSWNYPAWSISAEWHAYLVFPLLAWLLPRLGGWSGRWAILACCAVPLALYTFVGGHDAHPTNGSFLMLRALPLFLAGMLCCMQARWGASWLGLAPVLTCLVLAGPWPELAVLACPAMLMWALSKHASACGLSGSVSVWLGKVSYSLYMTHALVEMYVVQGGLRLAAKAGHGPLNLDLVGSVALGVLAMVLALALAEVVQRWVETPCRRALMRAGSKRKALA